MASQSCDAQCVSVPWPICGVATKFSLGQRNKCSVQTAYSDRTVRAMKAWGIDSQLHAFLTSALVVDDWLASCSDRFSPKESLRY